MAKKKVEKVEETVVENISFSSLDQDTAFSVVTIPILPSVQSPVGKKQTDAYELHAIKLIYTNANTQHKCLNCIFFIKLNIF